MSSKLSPIDVFSRFEPGVPFRFQLEVIAGEPQWMYAQFHEIKGKTVMFAYWDGRDSYAEEWNKGNADLSTIEPWDPTPTPADLATPVYIGQRDRRGRPAEFVLLPWTLGELTGSEWVNRHTYSVIGDCRPDYDRWGHIQLYHHLSNGEPAYGAAHMIHTVTLRWDVVTKGEYRDLIIEHWQRYDTMSQEQKIEVVQQRVAHCLSETKANRYNGKPSPSAHRELENARRFLQELSGNDLIPPDILNAGAKPGTQLSLF